MKKRSWTEEQLKNAVKSSFSYRQTIKKLFLMPTGGNYKQIKNILKNLILLLAILKVVRGIRV